MFVCTYTCMNSQCMKTCMQFEMKKLSPELVNLKEKLPEDPRNWPE